jgi:xylulokinase
MEVQAQAAGVALRWFRDTFGVPQASQSPAEAYESLISEAMASPPGARGLTFVPTFNGTTAPRPFADGRGTITGLSLQHGRPDFVRALLEGVACEIRIVLEALEAAGVQTTKIRVTGGAARSSAWGQILSDVLGRSMSVAVQPEVTILGAAMIAATGTGAFPNLIAASQEMAVPTRDISPSAVRDAYETIFERFRRIYWGALESGLARAGD